MQDEDSEVQEVEEGAEGEGSGEDEETGGGEPAEDREAAELQAAADGYTTRHVRDQVKVLLFGITFMIFYWKGKVEEGLAAVGKAMEVKRQPPKRNADGTLKKNKNEPSFSSTVSSRET